MMRLAIVAALTLLMAYIATLLLQRIVLAVLVAMMLLLSSCNSLQIPYPTGCHRAVRYAIYASNACVIQEI